MAKHLISFGHHAELKARRLFSAPRCQMAAGTTKWSKEDAAAHGWMRPLRSGAQFQPTTYSFSLPASGARLGLDLGG